jgi:hypothetical protein
MLSAFLGLALVACLHGHWPCAPATDAPTAILTVRENEWFTTSPQYQQAWWRADGGDDARADLPSDGAADDQCSAPTVRLVVSVACPDACGPIEVMRNDERLGTLLVADALLSAQRLPDWAQPPERAPEAGTIDWRRSVTVAVRNGGTLSLRSRCNARFSGGRASATIARACGERAAEVACD